MAIATSASAQQEAIDASTRAMSKIQEVLDKEMQEYGEFPEELRVTQKMYLDLISDPSTFMKHIEVAHDKPTNECMFMGVKIVGIPDNEVNKQTVQDFILRSGGDRMVCTIQLEEDITDEFYTACGLSQNLMYTIIMERLRKSYIVPRTIEEKVRRYCNQ